MGVGGMGEPVAWALKKLGAEVLIGDICEDTLHRVHQKLDCEKTLSTIGNHDFVLTEEVDVVVSCVPYSVTHLIARECAVHNIRYCDLGGNPEVSDKIHRYYRNARALNRSGCFTDLGLAPGLVNIIAEHGVQGKKPKCVELMCGGLPKMPDNNLRYSLVFHPKGLWNELTGLCNIITNGKHKWIPALSDVTDLNSFEAASTKGGLASTLQLMLDRGVQECRYQTLRYSGHYDYMNFLLKDCGLEHDYETFEKVIKVAAPSTVQDRVFLRVRVDDWVTEAVIEADEQWTAMQKGTAFPAAAVAALMAEGKLDCNNDRGPVLNYSHIPLDDFIEKLYKIGGLPVKAMFTNREHDIGFCFTDCQLF